MIDLKKFKAIQILKFKVGSLDGSLSPDFKNL